MGEHELMAWLQVWFERLSGRFDRLDTVMDSVKSKHNMLDGERLLDNQDLCELLHVSKRTLQRYRSSGELPYKTIYHKTYYKESDVEEFIRSNFAKRASQKHADDAGI